MKWNAMTHVTGEREHVTLITDDGRASATLYPDGSIGFVIRGLAGMMDERNGRAVVPFLEVAGLLSHARELAAALWGEPWGTPSGNPVGVVLEPVGVVTGPLIDRFPDIGTPWPASATYKVKAVQPWPPPIPGFPPDPFGRDDVTVEVVAAPNLYVGMYRAAALHMRQLAAGLERYDLCGTFEGGAATAYDESATILENVINMAEQMTGNPPATTPTEPERGAWTAAQMDSIRGVAVQLRERAALAAMTGHEDRYDFGLTRAYERAADLLAAMIEQGCQTPTEPGKVTP